MSFYQTIDSSRTYSIMQMDQFNAMAQVLNVCYNVTQILFCTSIISYVMLLMILTLLFINVRIYICVA